jgi:hypothetical protein
MKRITQILLGIVAIIAAASVNAFTPSVYVADNWTKERVGNVAFGGFMAVGVTSLFLGCVPVTRRRRKR